MSNELIVDCCNKWLTYSLMNKQVFYDSGNEDAKEVSKLAMALGAYA